MHRALPLVLAAAACGGAAPADPDAAPACEVPAAVIAGTPETDALADAPARCGAPAYAWSRDASLGTVVDLGPEDEYGVALLETLLDVQGLTFGAPLTHDARLRRVTYVTQDRGALVDATAFVAYPVAPADGGPLDVVLLLHGTSGFTDGCGVGSAQAYQLLGAAFAASGKIAVMPDYLGLRSDDVATGFPHPYLVGEATAIASLDAVRAALRMTPADRGGWCASGRVAAFGGSQGGHAALWVDRLAPYYARELELVGVAAAVPPSDLLAQSTRALTSIVNATGNTIAFLGVASPWYGAGLAGAFVPPWDADLPGILAGSCNPGDGIGTPTALSDVFTQALLDAAAAGTLADAAPYGCVIAENGIPTTSVPRLPTPSPSYGILDVFSENDELVDTPIERAAYEAECAGGMPMQFLECAGAGHTDGALWSIPEVNAFLAARFAGEAMTPACTATAPVVCAGTPTP